MLIHKLYARAVKCVIFAFLFVTFATFLIKWEIIPIGDITRAKYINNIQVWHTTMKNDAYQKRGNLQKIPWQTPLFPSHFDQHGPALLRASSLPGVGAKVHLMLHPENTQGNVSTLIGNEWFYIEARLRDWGWGLGATDKKELQTKNV